MEEKRKKKPLPFPDAPFPDAPFTEAYFGQPESCAELVNQYGTYNIQPTADTENTFPLIAHALPKQWREMALGKEETERE